MGLKPLDFVVYRRGMGGVGGVQVAGVARAAPGPNIGGGEFLMAARV